MSGSLAPKYRGAYPRRVRRFGLSEMVRSQWETRGLDRGKPPIWSESDRLACLAVPEMALSASVLIPTQWRGGSSVVLSPLWKPSDNPAG